MRLWRHVAIWLGLGGLVWGLVAVLSPDRGAIVGEAVGRTFGQTIEIIAAVFILIGLLQVWVPPKAVARLFGKEGGWKGLALAATIPVMIGGSLFTILPLMQALREKGARIAVIGAFITAWGGKLPLLPLEMHFLGWRFAALRLALIVPTAALLGLALEAIVDRKEPGDVGAS
ncbi:hypothetical protein DRJ54_01990 [Candidatus Acetothermia bacterium]|nr:MAG: hypothetical protein DRJ54_01990 [Candidatus Acetothermia bacterium]